mmetsp:Transcript_9573/g.27394  ORF Transcript_9573/g.27394 Transcript_9573/m.27394 type:complete len:1236 (-) Transcript_9573:119-3826(-)|eukprot:CAMPEP_0117650970 /NCGR_PEP_ID=MMETSP0804-20121206/1834_1 /TAXON_ID=1074897 /ORGANISM="Tetraselmis astigmatica, Strain CCMP880" /LENGTH=1235 /DNA_ID=CAMNT_0005456899 /DNA_START=215 /DNA_END=3922 /DNA_ORIENTATION=+
MTALLRSWRTDDDGTSPCEASGRGRTTCGRVFGEPFRSGAPLQFNRDFPWYIVESVKPQRERTFTQWAAVNHRIQAAYEEAAEIPSVATTSSARVVTAEGERHGYIQARATREYSHHPSSYRSGETGFHMPPAIFDSHRGTSRQVRSAHKKASQNHSLHLATGVREPDVFGASPIFNVHHGSSGPAVKLARKHIRKGASARSHPAQATSAAARSLTPHRRGGEGLDTGGDGRLFDDNYSDSDMSDDSEAEPGPGHYNIPSCLVEGPAFSMGSKAVRSAWMPSAPKEGLPGPAEYHSSGTGFGGSGPAFSMRGRAQHQQGQDSPGPGAYEGREDVGRGPAFSIAPPRAPEKPPLVPGPGEYHLKRVFDPLVCDGPAFSLRGRHSLPDAAQHRGDEPGPGDYQEEKPWRAGPAFSFTGKTAEPKDSGTPGPASFKMRDYWGHSGPAPTFGVKPVHAGKNAETPGPGDYKVLRRFDNGARDGPAYTMPGRAADDTGRQGSPGPAEYDVGAALVQERGPAYSMPARGTSMFDTEAADGPGPAAYGPLQALGRGGPAFSIRGRLDQPVHDDKLPGPGEYHHPSVIGGPAFTMGCRSEELAGGYETPGPAEYDMDRGQTEGPAFTIYGRLASPKKGASDEQPDVGTYNLPDAWKQGPAYTFGGVLAGQIPAADLPGPGEYEAEAAQRDPGPAYSMAGRRRQPLVEDAPGPGEYHTEGAERDGPAYSLGGRWKASCVDAVGTESPGPGWYDQQQKAEGPAFTFGEHLQPPEGENELGPGEYYVQGDLPHGPAYSMGHRIEAQDAKEDDPGPGQYSDIAHVPGGPAFSIRGRIPEPQGASELGPGEYLGHESTTSGPKITFGVRPLDPEAEPGIGPGQYELPGGPSGPAITIGTSLRQDPADVCKLDLPGPGAYSPEGRMEPGGPAFSLASKLWRGDDNNVPGPGAYTLEPNATGPKYSILGKAPVAAEDRDASEKPGPGAYNVDSRLPYGPAFSLAQRLAAVHEDAWDMPGPGQYRDPMHERGTAYTIAPKTKDPQRAHAIREAAHSPGPGDYGALGRDAPSGAVFTMAPRVQGLADKGRPGPGDYHGLHSTPEPPKGPAYTFGEKLARVKGARRNRRGHRTAPTDTETPTPGPQDYAPQPRYDGPSTSIGRRAEDLKPRKAPAPGDYKLGSTLEGSKHSLGASLVHGSPWAEALRRARENAPGPGSYNDAKPFPRPLGSVVSSVMGKKMGKKSPSPLGGAK